MARLFRRVLFWCHLTAGVAAGIVVLMMSITGVALTYQRQMQYWADASAYRQPPPRDAAILPPSALVERVRTAQPEFTPTTIVWRRATNEPVALTAGSRTLYASPYTGAVLGAPQGQRTRTFFSTMVSWHRYVAMAGEQRATGRAITGAANLVFLFIVVSGLYLWWPRSWTWPQLKSVVMFRGGLAAKARDFNWHNVIGFWSAIPLAVIVFSGVVISYPWATALVYRVVGDTPPAPTPAAASVPARSAEGSPRAAWSEPLVVSSASIDALWQRAAAHDPDWRILTMRWPAPGAPVVFTIDRGDGGQPHLRGTLTFDTATAGVRWEPFANQTAGRQARSWLRFLHTGEALGWLGQTIAGLVSLGAVFLVYTGLSLALRRLRHFIARSRRKDPVISNESRVRSDNRRLGGT
jgi:uncharacterized iron-regulated membrane protein